MTDDHVRDYITVQDEEGNQQDYAIEALFDMEDQSYVLLSSGEDTLLMRLEGEGEDQYLVGISDPAERDSILHAYQIAVDAAPAE